MKKQRLSQRKPAGFTLIELLVVISIIAILAGLLLPALSRAKRASQVAKAKLEMKGIDTAIKSYQGHYNRMPVSAEAMQAVTSDRPDQTYGTMGTGYANPNLVVHQNSRYNPNNSEVMAILMDIDPVTLQKGNPRNPDHIPFLEQKRVNTKVSGVGPDLVYRDPWNNPYIITIDLNYDHYCRDAFYKYPRVSKDPKAGNTGAGLRGLVLVKGSDDQSYEIPGDVAVWSFGPDKQASQQTSSNAGVNKDNVLSWE